MLDAVDLIVLLIIAGYVWFVGFTLLSRTSKIMTGLTDLQAAVAANTTATNAAIAALQSAAPGGDSDAAVEALATTLTTNNTNLTAAVSAFEVGSAPGPLAIATTALTDAVVNAPYTAQLSITGGVAPITTTISGLPAGLTDNGGGSFSGTPTTVGTNTLSVSASDSSSPPQNATALLTLVVDAAGA